MRRVVNRILGVDFSTSQPERRNYERQPTDASIRSQTVSVTTGRRIPPGAQVVYVIKDGD